MHAAGVDIGAVPFGDVDDDRGLVSDAVNVGLESANDEDDDSSS